MSYPVGSKIKKQPINKNVNRMRPGSNTSSAIATATAVGDKHANNKGGGSSLRVGQNSIAMSHTWFNKFPSDTLPTNAFTISTQFDTRWPASLVHTLENATVELTIQSASTSAITTLCHPSIWFPRIEVMSNGSASDCVLYDIMWYIKAMTGISDEARAQKAEVQWYNPNTARLVDGTTVTSVYKLTNYDTPAVPMFELAASSTAAIAVVYAEFRTFLTESKLFFPSLMVEPRLRFYTGNNITTKGSAVTTSPNLLTVNTFLRGTVYGADVLTNLIGKYSRRSSISRVLVYERQTFSLNITSGQTTNDLLLTALSGTYAYLLIILTQYPFSQDQTYSSWAAADSTNGAFWKQITKVNLFDANQNAYNFTDVNSNYYKFNVWPSHWQSALPFEKEIVMIPFTDCAQVAQDKGCDLGDQYMDGNWILRFTPQSAAVNTTDNIITAGMSAQCIVLGARVCTFTQLANGGVLFNRL